MPVGDHRPIPHRSVLVPKQDQRAIDGRPGRTPRFDQDEQGKQTLHLGLVGHQLVQEAGEADCLDAQIGSHQRVTGRGEVPFVEDQVDDTQYRGEPVGELRLVRHAIGNPRRPDLPLCTHEALCHRFAGDQKRPCDLAGLEAAQQPERQGNLGIGGKRWVATGEDQAQAVVVHGSLLGWFGALLHPKRIDVAIPA